MAHQRAQGFGDLVVRMVGGGSLFGGESGEARGNKGVGFGVLEIGMLAATAHQLVEDRLIVARCGKHDEGVFPVMTGRLDDEEERRRAECHQPGVVALAVLSDDDGLAGRRLRIIQTEHDVRFRRNSDRSEADLLNCNTQGLEAWAPALTLFVAKARTQAGKAAPQDTFRAQKAGRARQSYACGITRKQSAAILSRLPSRNPSQDSC